MFNTYLDTGVQQIHVHIYVHYADKHTGIEKCVSVWATITVCLHCESKLSSHWLDTQTHFTLVISTNNKLWTTESGARQSLCRTYNTNVSLNLGLLSPLLDLVEKQRFLVAMWGPNRCTSTNGRKVPCLFHTRSIPATTTESEPWKLFQTSFNSYDLQHIPRPLRNP